MVQVRAFVAGGVGIIGLILLLIAILSNGWYGGNGTEELKVQTGYSSTSYVDVTLDVNCGLQESKTTYSAPGYVFPTVNIEYDEIDHYEDTNRDGDVTSILSWIGFALGIGFVVLAILSGFQLIGWSIPLLLGLIAGISIIFGTFFFATYFPKDLEREDKEYLKEQKALLEEVTDETDEIDIHDKLHLCWAWYLSLIGGVMLIGGSLGVIGIKRKEREPWHQEYQYGTPPRRDDYYEDRRRDDYYDDRGRRDHSSPHTDEYHDPRDGRDHSHHRRDDYYYDGDRKEYPPRY